MPSHFIYFDDIVTIIQLTDFLLVSVNALFGIMPWRKGLVEKLSGENPTKKKQKKKTSRRHCNARITKTMDRFHSSSSLWRE